MVDQSLTAAAEDNPCWQNPFARSGWRFVPVALALLLLLGAASAKAQQSPLQAVGVPPFNPVVPVENGFVNPANGDLHLEIPLGTWAERGGKQFKAALTYDSNIWATYGTGSFWGPDNVSDGYGGDNQGSSILGEGWRLVTSAAGGQIYYTANYYFCTGPMHMQYITHIDYTNFYYVAADGNSIWFPTPYPQYVTRQGFNSVCNNGGYPSIPSGDKPDLSGSGYHLYVTNYTQASIFAHDGTRLTTATSVSGGGPSYSSPEDSNGNYPSLSGNANPPPVATDALGRNLVTTTVNGNNVYYDVSNSQSTTTTTSRYTVTTETIPVSTAFHYGVEDQGPIKVVQSVQLPDGTSYSFQYDSGTTPGHYGTLTSVTLPTGAQISYSYATFYDACLNPPALGVQTKTTPDSATPWKFAYVYATSPNCLSTTVTKPNGDNDVYTYAEGYGASALSQLQYYSGAVSSANLLATVTRTYAINQPVPTAETTTLPGPGGTSLNQTTQYTYDGGGFSLYAQLLQKKEWNFYTGNLPATPDRTTAYTYLGGSGTGYQNGTSFIVDRPTNVTVTNGIGATVSQTINCYDYAGGCGGSSFANAGSVVNHDTSYGPSYTFRGDLTQTQRLINGSSYLTKSTTYDSAGQLMSSTDWSNLSTHTTTYSYADNYVNDNTTNSEPLTAYTPSQTTDGYPTTVTAPIAAASMNYKYYYGTGQESSATDANGKTSYLHFGDLLDRPTSTKTPNGGWNYFVYPSGVKTPLDTGAGITSPTLSISCMGTGDCRHDQTQLDGLGRTIHKLLVSDPDGQSSVDMAYDSNGRASSISNPHRTTSQPTDGTETYPSYDGLDRKLQVTRADGSIGHTYYGPAVSSNGGQSSQLCSGFGLGYPVLTVDEAGHKRQRWTDGFGRLIEVDEPDSTNTLSVGTCYAYDLNDNLIGVRSLGGSEATCTLNGATYNRCFTYDMASRLLSAYNPEAGTITYAYDQDTNCPLPNSFPSQLVSKTDARGNRTCLQYDNLNRVAQKNYPSSTTPTVNYSYDSTNCLDVSPCSNLNRRTGMSDGSGQTSWSYDAVGNILEEKRTIGTVTKSIFYTYNLDSSIATIKYPSSRIITYQPGDAQRPLQAVDVAHSINYATSAHYAPPGELASLTNGGSFFLTSIFNNRLQPCWAYATTGTALTWNSTNTLFCTTSAATGSILDMKYNFNWGAGDNGNVMGITNNRDSTRAQAFTYDNLNRILTAETTSTYARSPTNCWAEQYGIDAVGNLTSIGPPTGNNNYNGCVQESGLSISVNGSNQIAGFCYDAAGNLQAQSAAPCPSPTYAYNAESQMTSTAGVTYTYDGEGRRVMKSNGALYWYGISSDPLAETDANGNTTNEYIFFGGKRIARQDSSNNTFYYFADQLGTSREIVQSGSTSPCYDADFYPFGGERIAKDSQGHPIDSCDSHYKFTGKERDSESGLDNFGARYNSSQYGRFMSPDPKMPSLKHLVNPQKWNKYAYTLNNPLRYFDPDGLEEMDIQLRSFIPQRTVSDPIGRTFAGDNRGFSSAANASSRTTITVRIETDASIRANPIISVTSSAGQTRQLDANGNVVNSATATTGLPTATGSRDANGNVVLNIQQNTANPLEPQSITPGIRANLDVTVPQNGSSVLTTGTVSGTPSFELNAGGTNIPLQSAPSSTAGFDLGLTHNNSIQNLTPLPPPPPPPPPCSRDRSC
jgi:RHS repeat-associated protein